MGWREFLDKKRISQLQMLETGIDATWATLLTLTNTQQQASFALAAEALGRYESFVDKPVMTGDLIWRFAYVAKEETLKFEYSANLTISSELEKIADVARWGIPTLIQFCFAAELLRRQMYSDKGREEAQQVGRGASDKVGCLSRKIMPLR